MHILFFGYGSHAKNIKSCCDEYLISHEDTIYSGIKRSNIKTDIDIFNSIDEVLLKNGSIDCVFITANNFYHLDIFKTCIEKKNKIYLCRKACNRSRRIFHKLSIPSKTRN